MQPATRDALTSTLAIALAGAVIVTCAANRANDRAPMLTDAPGASGPIATLPSASPPSASVLASTAPTTSTAPLASAPSPRELPAGALPLPKLYEALANLTAGTRTDHVRVAWLGDSHSAADLWTGAVRRGLQSHFGNGGPGFVRLGWDEKRYRHEGIKIETALTFNTAPVPYAKVKREDDGVFGLGGVRMTPVEADARALIHVVDKQIAGDGLRFDIAYRASAGESFMVKLEGVEQPVPSAQDDANVGLAHHLLEGKGTLETLEISQFKGHPQLFGVFIESTKPGVVLDTIGLNGARVGTFLAWDAATWQAELSRRKPELVVLAFGTNESSDDAKSPEKYRSQTAELLSRVKAAAPSSECLVILPMDRSGLDHERALATISKGMNEAAQAAGCATWSAFDAMGGAGSIEAWSHESPPRSGADGVHLTAKGYTFLGDKLASELLKGARARGNSPL